MRRGRSGRPLFRPPSFTRPPQGRSVPTVAQSVREIQAEQARREAAAEGATVAQQAPALGLNDALFPLALGAVGGGVNAITQKAAIDELYPSLFGEGGLFGASAPEMTLGSVQAAQAAGGIPTLAASTPVLEGGGIGLTGTGGIPGLQGGEALVGGGANPGFWSLGSGNGGLFATAPNAIGTAAALYNLGDAFGNIGESSKSSVEGLGTVAGTVGGYILGGPIGAGAGSIVGRTAGRWGASILDSLGAFGGKGEDQQNRDAFRDKLESLGLAEKIDGSHHIKLSDGTFNIGLDGSESWNAGTVNYRDGTPRRFEVSEEQVNSTRFQGLLNSIKPLAYAVAGKESKTADEMAAYLTTAAWSSSNPAETIANWYRTVSPELSTVEQLDQMVVELAKEGFFSGADVPAYQNALNQLLNPNYEGTRWWDIEDGPPEAAPPPQQIAR